jgi:hypothetical protein
MTWTKLGDEYLLDPAILKVPRGARLMHIESVIWSNSHGTDGKIPRHMLARFSDEPDTEQAAKELISAGLWDTTEMGWAVVGFLDQQPSAEDVERTGQLVRNRQRRQRQHRNGDHSLCDGRYCHQAAGGETPDPEDTVAESVNGTPATRDITRDLRGESRLPVPARPVPTRPVGTREGRGGTGSSSTAPLPPSASLRGSAAGRGKGRGKQAEQPGELYEPMTVRVPMPPDLA